MSSWANATMTAKGKALQEKLVTGGTFNITRVAAGSGKVDVSLLPQQTAVTSEKQNFTIQSVTYDDDRESAILSVLLANTSVATAYRLTQVGIYATDPDDGEILYAIMQSDDEGEQIPASTDRLYNIQFDISLVFSSATTVNVTIDPAGLVTMATIEKLMCVEIVPYGTDKPIAEREEGTFYFIIKASRTIEVSDNLTIKEAGE